jgi:hypothetical protein
LSNTTEALSNPPAEKVKRFRLFNRKECKERGDQNINLDGMRQQGTAVFRFLCGLLFKVRWSLNSMEGPHFRERGMFHRSFQKSLRSLRSLRLNQFPLAHKGQQLVMIVC